MECKQSRQDNEQSKKEYEDFVKQCIDNGQIKDIVMVERFPVKEGVLGDSFFNKEQNKWYYHDGSKWVLPLVFTYKNYKGAVSQRKVIPFHVYYGTTDFYTEPCWLLRCFDVYKKQERDFRMSDMVKA